MLGYRHHNKGILKLRANGKAHLCACIPCPCDQRHRESGEGSRAGAESENPLAAVPLRKDPAGDVAGGVAIVEGAEEDALSLRAPGKVSSRIMGNLRRGKVTAKIQ